MVGVREVRSPEEPVLAHYLHHAGQGGLVGVRRDPALALEVLRRLVLEAFAHERALGRLVDGVEAVQPVAHPARTALEHDDPKARELLEGAVLEERREGMPHRLASDHVLEERELTTVHLSEARLPRPERVEGRMDAERQAELCGRGEHPVVVRMRHPLAGRRKGRDPDALDAVAGGPSQLAFGRFRVA